MYELNHSVSFKAYSNFILLLAKRRICREKKEYEK